jgi:hypothetical protein
VRNPRQSWTRIHSLGAVTIGDDVEIGANTACIDRGTIRNTVIGRGTKLDNLVHIGHNVQVGERLPALRPGRHRRLGPHRRPGGAGRAMRGERQHLCRR